jgi:hypothetical protein
LRIDTAYPHTEVAGSLTDSQPKSTAAACSALFISSQYLSFPVTSAVILREEEKEEEKEEEEEEEEEGDDDEEEEARRAPLPSTLFVQTSGYRLSVLQRIAPSADTYIYVAVGCATRAHRRAWRLLGPRGSAGYASPETRRSQWARGFPGRKHTLAPHSSARVRKPNVASCISMARCSSARFVRSFSSAAGRPNPRSVLLLPCHPLRLARPARSLQPLMERSFLVGELLPILGPLIA